MQAITIVAGHNDMCLLVTKCLYSAYVAESVWYFGDNCSQPDPP